MGVLLLILLQNNAISQWSNCLSQAFVHRSTVCWKAYFFPPITPHALKLSPPYPCSSQASASSEATYHCRATEYFGVAASECHPRVHSHRQSPTHHFLEPGRQQVYWRLQYKSVGERQPHHHRHQAPARRSLYVQSHHSWHAKLYGRFSKYHRIRYRYVLVCIYMFIFVLIVHSSQKFFSLMIFL